MFGERERGQDQKDVLATLRFELRSPACEACALVRSVHVDCYAALCGQGGTLSLRYAVRPLECSIHGTRSTLLLNDTAAS